MNDKTTTTKKYNSIIFDWDGTLGMTLHLWLEVYRLELNKLGINLSDKIIVEDFFYEHDKTMKKYPDIDFDPFIQQVRKQMVERVDSMNLYDGVLELLNELKQNDLKMTLVSSSPRELIGRVLKLNDLDKFFTNYSGFDDIMKHKPDPEPFLNMIKIANLNLEKTIIVGDSINDIIAAKRAGLDSCLFLPEENKIFYNFDKLKESNPTFIIRHLGELINIIIK